MSKGWRCFQGTSRANRIIENTGSIVKTPVIPSLVWNLSGPQKIVILGKIYTPTWLSHVAYKTTIFRSKLSSCLRENITIRWGKIVYGCFMAKKLIIEKILNDQMKIWKIILYSTAIKAEHIANSRGGCLVV